MTTISGICKDSSGVAVAGRGVRIDRLDTGDRLGSAVSSDGSPLQLLFTDALKVSGSITNSGRTVTYTAASNSQGAKASTPKTAGKWYAEMHIDQSRGGNSTIVGVCETAYPPGGASGIYATLYDAGYVSSGGGTAAFGSSSFTTGDRIMFAMDMDARKVWLGKNGTWFNGGDPAAGTGANFSAFTAGTPLHLYFSGNNNSSQSRTATLKTGTTDFNHSPPSGFSSLDVNLDLGEYLIDCGSYTGDVIVYQFDPADLTIRPQIHISEPV